MQIDKLKSQLETKVLLANIKDSDVMNEAYLS